MQQTFHSLASQNPSLSAIIEQANRLIRSARSTASTSAYESDFRHFSTWAEQNGLLPLPATADTVALYTAAFSSTLAPATIARRLAAINKFHQMHGYRHQPASCKNNVLGEVMRGLRRVYGTAQRGRDPILTGQMRSILLACPESLSGLRDRALLGVTFSAAFRRSEAASLRETDVEETDSGLIIHLRRSKTDQCGNGRTIGIPFGSVEATCPVRNLKRWLDAAGITCGPLFRSVDRHSRISSVGLGKDSVGRIVKRAAARAGLDPTFLSGHSLRSGHCTSAALRGASTETIMRQTGHATEVQVRKYIKVAQLFSQNSATSLGL